MTTVEERLKLLEDRLAALEPTQKIQVDEEIQKDSVPKDETSKAATKPTSRARVVINKWDSKTDTRKDYDLDDLAESTSNPKAEHDYAFLLRKLITGDQDDSELEIVGTELRPLLQTLFPQDPYHMFLGDTIALSSPFEPLVLNWDLLEDVSRQPGRAQDDQIARNDLKLLLDTIKEGSDTRLDEYFKIRESLKASKSITYDTLWTIFPIGCLVYSNPFLKLDQIFIVQDHRRSWPLSSSSRSKVSRWILKCWTYDWNGQFFQRYGIDLAIDEFSGAKPITSLPVHPLDAIENPEVLKKNLWERGELFRKYCTISKERHMYKYEWKAILDKDGFRGISNEPDYEYDSDSEGMSLKLRNQRPESVSGEVMVDFESYYKHGLSTAQMGFHTISEETSECKCSSCTNNMNLQDLYRSRYDGKKGGSDENWELEQTMLCPPRVLGYVLREKQWVQLAVHKIEEISHKGEADAFWGTLRLAGEDGGKETKEMLHALIKSHGLSEGRIDDLVAEKGKGLVILLYGPPGVGKTSTAQTIATAARKPLFSIGVADVGTNAGLVESNLEKVFDLATTWRAVLLIDEADVFLQSRARGQMGPTTERNALVSVFLRVLEYFQGILILTTNQISQFDVAVQSRIHIAIRYEGLDKAQTVAIFKGFLNQYKAKGLVQPDDFERIMVWVERDLSRRKFDGRQIRNVVTSAMGLACADEKRRVPGITIDDLQNVINYMIAFKTDLDYQMRQYEEAQSGVRNPYT